MDRGSLVATEQPADPRATTPLPDQIGQVRRVSRWYLRVHHQQDTDLGVGAMFCDPARVGAFAVDAAALAAGEPAALYRVLTAVVMFQRRQDQQITRVLRGISPEDADELSDPHRLLQLAEGSGCPLVTDLDALKTQCDLTKVDGVGACAQRPEVACAPKRHTVLLKRYGHFGKVPTGLALAIREAGAADLADLYAQVTAACDPVAAAIELERVLTRAWRVSDKIAAMYLSILCNDQLSRVGAAWAEGVDPARFVVIDSNVDLFLGAIGYQGAKTYAARRAFIQAVAREVDLSALKPGLRPYDPRLLQQAMYMFMSATNRRAGGDPCGRDADGACGLCGEGLAAICPMRARPRVDRGVPARAY